MQLSTTQPLTYPNYETYTQVWKPQILGDQGLFLVRVPHDLTEITNDLYEQLMQLRIQWMIRTWITHSGETQLQTARRLAQALQILYSQQMPPMLCLQGTQELRPLEEWAEDWGQTLVHHNETLMTRFELQNGWIFPTPVQLPLESEIQITWQTEHDDEFTLATWLSYLTADMS